MEKLKSLRSLFGVVLLVAGAWCVCGAETVDVVTGTSYGVGAAHVDGTGVLRWDDGQEVALFGVNYYTPFALDYRVIGERGYDRKEVIRRDVAHFRRLGFTALRLHCFDREISTREGALFDNDHLDLLDYLIAVAASNGLHTVLTPIAAWGGGKWTSTKEGFACSVTMRDLTSRPDLRRVQARYEEEFARHVNRYTGYRYADDPAVLAFELINEPAYTNGTTGAEIAAFANALLDGIRRSGTKKPVFYSATWNQRNDCIPHLRTDGVTGVYYATGLRAESALEGPQLGRVRASSLAADPRHAKLPKIVYEFDAADTPGAYMYPAMARLFRSEGVQCATQFQYDPTPIADSNDSYMTHYLNLVYTPEKAISMAIAAEVFRRLPRGAKFEAAHDEMTFPPFRVRVDANLSEMVTRDRLYYTATPRAAAIPAPEALEHVWGCGTSSVAGSTGNGCYFLDRVETGLWRLQLYPSVMPIADPYTGAKAKKTVILPDQPTLTVHLPDLGDAFAVFATKDGACVGTAETGSVTLAPGDYVLMSDRKSVQPGNGHSCPLAKARAMDLPLYSAPPPDKGTYRRWPRPVEELAAELRAREPDRSKVNLIEKPASLWAQDFKKTIFVDAKRRLPGHLCELAYPDAGAGTTLVVCGHAGCGRGEPIEIAVTQSDGLVWGIEVTLPEFPSEIRIPFARLRHFSHWDHLPDPPKGTLPDFRRFRNVSLAFGAWLNPKALDLPHQAEINALRVE